MDLSQPSLYKIEKGAYAPEAMRQLLTKTTSPLEEETRRELVRGSLGRRLFVVEAKTASPQVFFALNCRNPEEERERINALDGAALASLSQVGKGNSEAAVFAQKTGVMVQASSGAFYRAYPLGHKDRVLLVEAFGGDQPILSADACRYMPLQMKAIIDLSEKATHDPLTGILNRVGLAENFERLIREGNRANNAGPRDEYKLMTSFIDLDKFKQINDTHGHETGDAILKKTADLLTATLHRPLDIVARLGGDEFVVIGLVRHDQDANTLVSNILNAFRGTDWNLALPPESRAKYPDFNVGATIGAGVQDILSQNQPSLAEALNYADGAMYSAKNAGRGRGAVHDSKGEARIIHGTAPRMVARHQESYSLYSSKQEP